MSTTTVFPSTTASASINGGKLTARALQRHGVQQLFTLCGGHIAPIYVEAEAAGVAVIDVRHEASAVFAADAVARLTGIPGVAVVTAGPGVTNSITALKNAQLAQSPLVLLGGATATLLRGRGALQDIDQMALVRPHVKWATRISRLAEIEPVLHHAFFVAQKGVPGPVFVEIPVDLLYPPPLVHEWYGKKAKGGKGIVGRATAWYVRRHLRRLFRGSKALPASPGAASVEPPKAEPRQVSAIARALAAADRPVLLIGSGALMVPAEAEALAAAVQQLGIPVFLSGMARGLTGHRWPRQYRHGKKKALRAADCILLAGVPCDFRLDYGGHLNRRSFTIAVNRSRQDLKQNLRANLTVRADPGRLIRQLARHRSEWPDWEPWRQQLDREEAAREAEIETQAGETTDGINPLLLLRRLERRLPFNSVLIADGGDFAASAAYTLRPRRPLTWLDPGAFGTLGVGGGFALGAAQCYPDDYLWIIYGDGSAAYSLMEFDTFVKQGMKVCAIIGNNGSWQQIARDQKPLLGSTTATTLPKSDYHLIARAFGAAGERLDTPEQIDNAIQRAIDSMDRGIPYLINAVIGTTEFRKGSISM